MPLTEAEELELLELEEEEARAKSQSPSNDEKKPPFGIVGEEIVAAGKKMAQNYDDYTRNLNEPTPKEDYPIIPGQPSYAQGSQSHKADGTVTPLEFGIGQVAAAASPAWSIPMRAASEIFKGGMNLDIPFLNVSDKERQAMDKDAQWALGKASPVAKAAGPTIEKATTATKKDPGARMLLEGLASLPGIKLEKELGLGALKSLGRIAKGETENFIGSIGRKIDPALGEIAEDQTAIPEDVLRMAGTKEGRAFLKENQGRAYEIGQRLVDGIYNPLDNLPEAAQAKEIIQRLPAVNPKPIIDELQKAMFDNPSPKMQRVNEKLMGDIEWLMETATKNGNKIPTRELENIRIQLDELIGDAYGKESDRYITALKKARHQARQSFIDAAHATKRPEYITAMESLAQKLQTIDKIKDRLGGARQTGEGRAESFVRTLFNKGRTDVAETLRDYDQMFGTNFVQEANAAHLGENLNRAGNVPWFTKIPTGRSGMLGKIGAVTVGSPKVMSKILNVTERMAKVGEPPIAPKVTPAPKAPLVKPSAGSDAIFDELKPEDLAALAALKQKIKPEAPKAPDMSQEDPFWNMEKANRSNDPEALKRANAEATTAAGYQPEDYSPPDFDQAMDASEQSGYHDAVLRSEPQNDPLARSMQSIRNFLFPGSKGDISLETMDRPTREHIEGMVEDMNLQHDNDRPAWEDEWGSKGFPDRNDLTPDDFIQMMNEKTIGGGFHGSVDPSNPKGDQIQKPRKSNPLIDLFGNERGSLGTPNEKQTALDRIDNLNPIKIEKWEKLPPKEMRKKVAEVYPKGKESVNSFDGKTIHFGNVGIDEINTWWHDYKYEVVPHLQQIMREAVPLPIPPRKSASGKGVYSDYAHMVETQDGERWLRIVVRKDANGNYHYDHMVEATKSEGPQTNPPQLPATKAGLGGGSKPSRSNIIQNFIDDVNTTSKNSTSSGTDLLAGMAATAAGTTTAAGIVKAKTKAYDSEEDARLAGHGPGDRVRIKGIGIVELE